MVRNCGLNVAKNEKNDEFYTQFEDIDFEMVHYFSYFVGKTILCNCDDPRFSNFWKYFHMNFENLGLKKLISIHYERDGRLSYKMIYMGGNDLDVSVGVMTALVGNGDFRSGECIEILKEADIVVTNPPFSLFREYITQLMTYRKKFIILGNQNAVTCKDIFPLIQTNQLWYGASIHSGDRKFGVPDTYPLEASGCGIDKNGQRFIRVKGIRLFTNLDITKRHLAFFDDKFKQSCYYGHDYDAINVDRTKDIPVDYDGIMGVPITFLDKYNPDEFEIIGLDRYAVPSKFLVDGRLTINGKRKYARILIRKKRKA